MLDALKDRGIPDSIYVVFYSDYSEILGYFGMYAQYMPREATRCILY